MRVKPKKKRRKGGGSRKKKTSLEEIVYALNTETTRSQAVNHDIDKVTKKRDIEAFFSADAAAKDHRSPRDVTKQGAKKKKKRQGEKSAGYDDHDLFSADAAVRSQVVGPYQAV